MRVTLTRSVLGQRPPSVPPVITAMSAGTGLPSGTSAAVSHRRGRRARVGEVNQAAGVNVAAATSKMERLASHWPSGTDQ